MPTHPAQPDIVRMRLFGLDIIAASFSEAVAILTDAVASRRGPAGIVSTPNVDHVVRLDKQPDLQPIYRQAAYLFADGMPIVWASRLLGRPLPERVTGSDLFVALCRQAVAHGWKIAILGGMPGDGPMLESRFAATYPGIDVTVMTPSMRFDPLGDEGREAADRIRALAPDLVFVCLGMPKQETWAGRYAATLPHGLVLCVGAAMEFAVGLQRRAPRLVQRMGMEWLWRLLSNPGRLWRRYLKEDPRFFAICWREYRSGVRDR
ncbi:WecB/TagA/CpsF family glycosyltransferase [Pigmentiphaga sp.]|uniref:WecB/TagA/CpsF family glycosyltransferase n=1 Tax=Pigmentiphaga sp. TaxID=1977564 RepID=UPI00128E62B7|nr:WecB/TagA/CpsF family glycosyltransferase [Pigmentiphaga sp.]MPS26816.1 glycosyltransferase [Alcaligenaceae bacterium SAGV5]MPS55339.1 glycosyltransferase [Alcaligenaceae bacterium SAGV3]MPT57168.1 glycosyltransferase [Alcaligenaceae bacterium]